MLSVEAYPDVAGVVAAASAFVRFRPGLCALRVAGRSREGRPLYVLTVGRDRPGVRNVLVVAGEHADQRGGGAAALRLAERVALDPRLHVGAGAAWHFLLCLDPDGAARTEAGPAVRRTLAEHFRHACRRGEGELLLEERALAALTDELRPVLRCALRGVEVGGVRVRLSREVRGFSGRLATVCAERRVALRAGPVTVAADDSGCLTATIEVPMWSAPSASDPLAAADLATRLTSLRRTPTPAQAAALLRAHPASWLPVPTQLDVHATLTLALAEHTLL